MTYSIRPMELGDVHQVAEVEREAFSMPWPTTNFRRELMFNKSAHYLVAYDDAVERKELASENETVDCSGRPSGSKLEMLRSGLKRLFSEEVAPVGRRELIVGFIGIWFLVDETHLANIAVREAYRRRGIGGLLVSSAIELAVERNAQFVTLEVRASNEAAQTLYEKYGFTRVAIRHGYYTDKKQSEGIVEDAVIMTKDLYEEAVL